MFLCSPQPRSPGAPWLISGISAVAGTAPPPYAEEPTSSTVRPSLCQDATSYLLQTSLDLHNTRAVKLLQFCMAPWAVGSHFCICLCSGIKKKKNVFTANQAASVSHGNKMPLHSRLSNTACDSPVTSRLCCSQLVFGVGLFVYKHRVSLCAHILLWRPICFI